MCGWHAGTRVVVSGGPANLHFSARTPGRLLLAKDVTFASSPAARLLCQPLRTGKASGEHTIFGLFSAFLHERLVVSTLLKLVMYVRLELSSNRRRCIGPNPGPGRPPGRDGHRAVRPPEPPSGRQNGGSAERNDYHAAQMLQLQRLQMQRMKERERERDRTRESRRVMGSDAGGYWRDSQRQKANGPSRRNVEINKQITVCQDSRDLCALIGCSRVQQRERWHCLPKAPAEPATRSGGSADD